MALESEHRDQIDLSDAADGADLMSRVTPGEILNEAFMDALGRSAKALARALLHVPPNRITATLNGIRSITADGALRRARYFNTTPQPWPSSQKNDELLRSRSERWAAPARPRLGPTYPKRPQSPGERHRASAVSATADL